MDDDGELHEQILQRLVVPLLSGLKSGAMLLADRGYDADWIRGLANQHGALQPNAPARTRKSVQCDKTAGQGHTRSGRMTWHLMKK
jgi:hypothetical protein